MLHFCSSIFIFTTRLYSYCLADIFMSRNDPHLHNVSKFLIALLTSSCLKMTRADIFISKQSFSLFQTMFLSSTKLRNLRTSDMSVTLRRFSPFLSMRRSSCLCKQLLLFKLWKMVSVVPRHIKLFRAMLVACWPWRGWRRMSTTGQWVWASKGSNGKYISL